MYNKESCNENLAIYPELQDGRWRQSKKDGVKDGIKDNLFLKGMNYIFSFYFFLKSTELC